MNKTARTKSARGYALTEVLIATAIAAGLLTTIAGALSNTVRVGARSAERVQIVQDAKLIAARIHAGISDSDLIAGLTGWRIESAPLAAEENGSNPSIFVVVVATHQESKISIEFLARHEELR